MKKYILLFLLCLNFSCALKNANKSLSEGNYDQAIDISIGKLKKNKNKKGNQNYVYILEESYAKSNERDQRSIDLLLKDSNPQNLEKVYNIYVNLNKRQEKIRPLLPLQILKENRQAQFKFEDYSEQLVNSKNALVKYLYENSKALLATNSKVNFRRAYDDLIYVNELHYNYKDISEWIAQAKLKGTDFVEIYTNNQTNIAIPQNLLNALLDFNTYGINEKWITYHSKREKNIQYDYAIDINFTAINVTPEQLKEKEFIAEKEISFGKIKKTDSRGNVVTDSLGKVVYVDDLRIVKAKIKEVRQFKATQVYANVEYVNLKTNKVFKSFPIMSEFIFENIFAKYKGDIKAVDTKYQNYFKNNLVPFPSNEQMIFDTGEDLKQKIKNVISNNKIVQ